MGYTEIIFKSAGAGVIVTSVATVLRNHVDDSIVRSAIGWIAAALVIDTVKESITRRKNRKEKSVVQ